MTREENVKTRIKTDMRIDADLSERVKELCDSLGITQASFYSLASAYYAAELARLLPLKKDKKKLLKAAQKQFTSVADSIFAV